MTPPQVFVGSFALLIGLGTLGLKFLPGLYVGPSLGWQDALFTSTSAVCVTGLIVVDTATYFTPAGQAFLLLLIQVGGLGMLTLTSMVIAAIGGRLSLRAETILSGGHRAAPAVDRRRLLMDVVRFTLLIELLGAVLLYAIWVPRLGWVGAAWPATFHSVSAFCNSGFSVNSDSLVGSAESTAALTIVMALVVLGGIGFLTLEEVYCVRRDQLHQKHRGLSLHSRVVMVTTALLIVTGWGLYAVFEWNQSLAGLSAGGKLQNALFMSVTSRTAGFNTIDYGAASDGANFLTILLMMIGGSPGSAAGGIKTTTFALLGLLAWSRLKAERNTTAGKRTIPDDTIQRAVGLVVIAVGILAIGVFMLTAAETRRPNPPSFLACVFEAVSAFGTVGLSMGLTDELTTAGRAIVTVLMFLGRVGPLSLGAAFVLRRSRGAKFRYAYEDVMVG